MSDVVLILEDEPAVGRLQRKRLERAGYAVESVATAADATARLSAGGITLLVLDYRLPDAPDGLEFYRQLKAAGLGVPVIMVTGQTDDRTVVRALRAGVRDYVTKSPEYLDYLPEAVARVLAQEHDARERRRAEAELREANAKLERAMAELRARTDELQATTQQLWQSAKLASVGELAASIAHELNNPLGTISLRLESVLLTMPPDAPCRPLLEVVEGEVERMARLISNLLHFSRPSRDEASTVDVCEEVAKTADLARHHLARRSVAIRLDFAPQLPHIYADKQKLRQVFLNLFTNAGDAMPDGGTLTVRAFAADAPDGRPGLAVEVTDTGAGIPPDILPKVMDPFFTTKEEGKGTGLGLAICRRIVHDHGGAIQIDSRVGAGTTVRLILPLAGGGNVGGLV